MAEELPESLRDPKAVLERGELLNQLLVQRNTAWKIIAEQDRLLKYVTEHSSVKHLLSEGFLRDVERVLTLTEGSPPSREAKS